MLLALGMVLLGGVGILIGLLGGGGSLLSVPILRYVLGYSVQQAVMLSLVVVLAAALTAVVKHHRAGTVRYGVALQFAATSVAASMLAARLSHYLPGTLLMVTFAVFAGAAALAMQKPIAVKPSTQTGPMGFLALGALAGGAAGLLGAGGGFIVVPTLVRFAALPMRQAIGTSLVVISLQSAAALSVHLLTAAAPPAQGYWLVAAAAGCALVGATWSARLDPGRLRQGFASLLWGVAALVLARELCVALRWPVWPAWSAAGAVLLTMMIFRERAQAT